MSALCWRALESARLATTPFDHVAIAQVLEPASAAAIPAEFPAIPSSGSYSLSDAPPGPALSALIDDMMSDRFRTAMERLFDLDLAGRPVALTLRGRCAAWDGRIHTDSRTKVLSLLIYLNEGWTGPDGQLRLLNSDRSLDDYAVEIPASLGSMVAFRRTDNSWHGHSPFVGQRRALQFNYLQHARASVVGQFRHRLSALTKQLVA